MNEQISVSVIVTCYNVDEFIAQTLNSLLEQSHTNLDVIIIDDASTDHTVAIAESLVSNDNRFHIVKLATNTPGGAGPPSNIGIKKAKGDYLTFLDGDDYLSANAIELLLDEAVQQQADITISNYKKVETSTNQLLPPPDTGRWGQALERCRAGATEDLRRIILRFNSVPWRKLYLTKFVTKNSLLFPEGDFFYEDNPLHWRSTLLAEKFALVPQDLFFHRVDREGQTTTGNEAALFKMFLHHETIYNTLKDENKENYTPYLLCWLTSQITWISQRTSDENIDELYDVIRPCMLKHNVSDIIAALKIGDYSRRVYCLWIALIKGNQQVFRTWVRGGSMPRSMQYRLMYFIRRDGLIKLLTGTRRRLDHGKAQTSEQLSNIEKRLQKIEAALTEEAIKSEKKFAALFLLLGEISSFKTGSTNKSAVSQDDTQVKMGEQSETQAKSQTTIKQSAAKKQKSSMGSKSGAAISENMQRVDLTSCLKLPNVLIVGAQKSGTTWLHACLKKSPYVFAPEEKELNFFNRRNYLEKLDSYTGLFKESEEPFRLESSPNYFKPPNEKLNVASNVQSLLPNAKCIVVLRNPIERYLSAYTHHMMQERLDYAEVISEIKDDYGMVSWGRYSGILSNWLNYFPDTHVLLYDDICKNKARVVSSVSDYLGRDLKIKNKDLDFRTNDKNKKSQRLAISKGEHWKKLPALSEDVRQELYDIYSGSINELEQQTGRDLSAWRSSGK